MRHWLSFLLTIVAAASCFGQSWKVRFQLDEAKRQLRLFDLAFPSNNNGIATGILNDGSRNKAVSLVTSDGGRSWSMVEIDDAGKLFFLTERLGWMIGAKGVYRTSTSGAVWEKVSGQKGINDIFFLDESRGYAVGNNKQAFETTNGGRSWNRIQLAVSTRKENTVMTVVSFINRQSGLMLGVYSPPYEPYRGFLPEMEPERASSLISSQTIDGGKSWVTESISVFGYPARLLPLVAEAGAGNSGLILFRFRQQFDFSSIVYKVGWGTSKMGSFLKEKDWIVTDMDNLKDGRVAIAEVKRAGTLTAPEFPTGIRVILGKGPDDKAVETPWQSFEAPYKIQGANPQIAVKPDGAIWLMADTGAILELVN